MASKSNTFSSRDTWEEISVKKPIAEWWSLIWYSMAIPKHSFILWLAVKDSLSTVDRILNGEYKGKLNAFSVEAALNVRTICFFVVVGFCERIWRAAMQKCCQPDIHAVICKLAFGSAVHNLWR